MTFKFFIWIFDIHGVNDFESAVSSKQRMRNKVRWRVLCPGSWR
jgi:hypothetical protein